jgi:hypothetical protein
MLFDDVRLRTWYLIKGKTKFRNNGKDDTMSQSYEHYFWNVLPHFVKHDERKQKKTDNDILPNSKNIKSNPNVRNY